MTLELVYSASFSCTVPIAVLMTPEVRTGQQRQINKILPPAETPLYCPQLRPHSTTHCWDPTPLPPAETPLYCPLLRPHSTTPCWDPTLLPTAETPLRASSPEELWLTLGPVYLPTLHVQSPGGRRRVREAALQSSVPGQVLVWVLKPHKTVTLQRCLI